MGNVLGLFQTKMASADEDSINAMMQLIIKLRHNSRDRKDYATSDTIRSQLKTLGISLEDSSDGTTTWKKTIN